MNATLSRLGRAALDLLYPPRCVICGKGGGFLCPGCVGELPRAEGRRCARCWLPLHGPDCETCRSRPLALTQLRSGFRFEGEARRLVHELKFQGSSVLAAPMAAALAARLDGETIIADCITSVPLSSSRRRTRGFDQAGLLARELAEHLDLLYVELLARTRSSSPQAQAASAEERRRNVEGAFKVRDGVAVADRHVLLVDDVATTGATLDACARALIDAGAAAVSAVTFARED